MVTIKVWQQIVCSLKVESCSAPGNQKVVCNKINIATKLDIDDMMALVTDIKATLNSHVTSSYENSNFN